MPGLSPLVSLATQMQSQKGGFAVLLGSGVSTGAGLPTGWQVVKELVRRAAAAHGNEPPTTDTEVEAWWSENGAGELGYSSLLEDLAPTSSGRQALLEGFFEAAAEEDSFPPGPSDAHRSLARLVASGHVRVVITTNFDRLTEQALSEVGVQAQVIARPEAVAGMKPLAHSAATVIKLHGDYKDLTTLNTPKELSGYPPQWQALIAQVLDEYGLLIVGWSAEWDMALVHAIEDSASRRYPMYWDSRSSRKGTAQALLTVRSGIVVQADNANTLLRELEQSVDAIDRLAEAPITTAVAVTRLKRYLPDPLRRIELRDLLLARIPAIRDAVELAGAAPMAGNPEYAVLLDAYLESTRPLLSLVVAGAYYDVGEHHRLWGDILERLLALRRAPEGTFNGVVWAAQHLPALLAFYGMSAAALLNGDEAPLISFFRDHSWKNPHKSQPEPAGHVLRPDRILDGSGVNAMSQWEGQTWENPASHLVRDSLRGYLEEFTPSGATGEILDDLEYRHALLIWKLPGGIDYPLQGDYRNEENFIGRGVPPECGQRFRAAAQRAGSSWPWAPIIGDDLTATLEEFEGYVPWGRWGS